MTTSSPNKKSYNHLALRGNGVDDMEFVKRANEIYNGALDPALAYTPDLVPAMIDLGIQEDINRGTITPEEGSKRKVDHLRGYKELLAKNGMLKGDK